MTNFSLAAMPESSKAKHPELYNAPKFKATCCKCGKVDMLDHAPQGLYFCSYGCT